MTSISSYVDLTLDVKKLPQFDKIKEILDLAILVFGFGMFFGYKKTPYKPCLMERAMHLFYLFLFTLYLTLTLN